MTYQQMTLVMACFLIGMNSAMALEHFRRGKDFDAIINLFFLVIGVVIIVIT